MKTTFSRSILRIVILSIATLATHAGVQESKLNESLFKSLQFRALGPAIMGGRIDDFAVVESNPHIIYAATASGGLWKTVNNGVTWEPLFDGESHSSIGDVTIAPSNPDIVWVGTGEANNRQSSSWGNGVYKSADGGKT
ncbi:MAG: WD40/YVTN/BNR-like repeat-containing protein, partial [Blastocatellia bacterium]